MPFDAPPDLVADWFELRCVASSLNRINFSDVSRVWESNKDSEDTSPTGEDIDFDQWLQKVMEVIQNRIEILGVNYPFDLRRGDTEISYLGAGSRQPGRLIYLFCLFLSAAPETEIFEAPVEIDMHARNLFQVVSTWAAAGAISGSSYSFGWPRLEGTAFLTALRHVFDTLMNDEDVIVQSEAPPGASGSEKDCGIDVIAWRPRPDSCGGKLLVMGQVASGKNWRNKPIQHYIGRILQMWLYRQPSLVPIPAIFIPFSLRRVDLASHQEQVRFESAMYGAIFYREILPIYAAEGLSLGRHEPSAVHRTEDFSKLVWAKNQLVKQLREAQLFA